MRPGGGSWCAGGAGAALAKQGPRRLPPLPASMHDGQLTHYHRAGTAHVAGRLTRDARDGYPLHMMRPRAKLQTVVALSFTLVVLTKVVSAPMRLAGAIISITPVAGSVANDAIGKAANPADDVPI